MTSSNSPSTQLVLFSERPDREPSEHSPPNIAPVTRPHPNQDAFTAVTITWSAVADSPDGRAALARWTSRCPDLALYRSPGEVMSAINQLGEPDRSCALLADLLLVADHDPLVQLAVLRAVLPGLRRAVRQRWTAADGTGPWPSKDDLAADAVSAAWETISRLAGKPHRLPARLIIRRVERRLRTIHDAHRRDQARALRVADIRTITEPRAGPSETDQRFAHDLAHAVQTGQLDPTSAAVAYRIALLGQPVAAAGRPHNLNPVATREAARLVLATLAGANPPPTPTRPKSSASTKEVPLVPAVPQPADHRAEPIPTVLPLLLTVNQAAQMLGIGRSTLYELIDAGNIRSVKRGASRRIPLKEVHGYIDRLLDGEDGPKGGPVPSTS